MIKQYINGQWVIVAGKKAEGGEVKVIVSANSESGVIVGRDVPALTAEQLQTIYNEIVAGNSVVIESENEEYFAVKEAHSNDDVSTIYVDFEDSHILKYELTEDEEVEITATKLGEGNVLSVNGKVGTVVLDATDIKLTTTQTTVQANIIRIDEEINRVDGEIETVATDLESEITARESLDGRVEVVEASLEDLQALIPSEATSNNKLADKAFVNSSIATNTAIFRGTYDVVDDLGLTQEATHTEVAEALADEITTVTNNDYAFVFFKDAQGQVTRYDRYKYNGTAWAYEYTLNNSSFTAQQWAAINSGITSSKVETYDGYAALIAAKADADDVYDKTTMNTLLGDKADDDAVVHLSGNETIIGNKTIENTLAFKIGTRTWKVEPNLSNNALFIINSFNQIVAKIPYNGGLELLNYDLKIPANKVITDGTNGITVGQMVAKQDKATTQTITTATYTGGLTSNINYVFSSAVTALSIQALEVTTGDEQPYWSLDFTAGTGIAVSFTPTITWADGTPTFVAGSKYTITIKKVGTSYVATLLEY